MKFITQVPKVANIQSYINKPVTEVFGVYKYNIGYVESAEEVDGLIELTLNVSEKYCVAYRKHGDMEISSIDIKTK